MENIHDGHRQRMKARFLNHGLENFSDVEALEILLFYAIPRRDTNEIAHELLNAFHSFRGVMEASAEELSHVPGVGDNAAALIKLTTALSRRYMRSEHKLGTILENADQAGQYLLPLFAYEREEIVVALCMDSKNMVCHCQKLEQGMVNQVTFATRSVVDMALKHKAARVILAHNHLSGTALPSNADISSTIQLKNALNMIGVQLIDHIIVCDNDFVSMMDSGFLS